jgi:long-chain acyl-CoA synthetase
MNLASLADQNLAEYGVYERLLFEGQSYTNRELHDRSLRLATALGALGLSPDDKVVVMMPNRPEVLVSYPAIWRAGMTAIPVLFMLEASELRFILENSEAKAIITSRDIHGKVRAAVQELGREILVILASGSEAGAPPQTLSFDELIGKHEPMTAVVPREKDDLATILYTSGTTGQPKGVMQTHHNLYSNTMNSWNTSANRERNETSLLVLPLAHSFGLAVLVGGYLFGGKAVLMPWFKPEGALELIQKHRVKAMAGVPTMFVYMLMHPDADQYDTSSVTRWLVGAAPMPMEQLRAFEEKFGGTMYVGYGLTESCPGVAVEREGMPRKAGSTGTPMEGVTVKIVDDDAKELGRGQIGEVIVTGENISPGYYRNHEATKEMFRDEWLFTGDVGYLDDDGYLFIVERKKDLIIRAGFNVYPKDVEEVIYRHAAVQEAAVVGVPDDRMGEEVCAYVVKKQGAELTEAELVAHCQANLAKYKTPRFVEFLSALPKTNIGKIQKKELRKLAKEKHAR